ncbi:unnamed protein product [Eruca vesicaria subsp. sativa]|uniref:non-specific serine/threonine protein kinase n=1 Tax=Eruca vesicaria subsp. sativa TaxID=29727 RepID=A0ABC8JNY7_ERUVS|nr:unnamed protein product [Eruca vesicaria subsp. sativa]
MNSNADDHKLQTSDRYKQQERRYPAPGSFMASARKADNTMRSSTTQTKGGGPMSPKEKLPLLMDSNVTIRSPLRRREGNYDEQSMVSEEDLIPPYGALKISDLNEEEHMDDEEMHKESKGEDNTLSNVEDLLGLELAEMEYNRSMLDDTEHSLAETNDSILMIEAAPAMGSGEKDLDPPKSVARSLFIGNKKENGNKGQENQNQKYNNRFQYWGEHFASSKLNHFLLLEKEAQAININSEAYYFNTDVLIFFCLNGTIDQVTSQASIMSEVVISSKRHTLEDINTEDLELPLMDFEAIAIATNNFSNTNELGKGGFGIVYKGRLLGGKEIAVKRLSKLSLQGKDEFENEVGIIARLQHINLVRLLGYCVDKGENMLIYEYLENLSLDSHLFDKSRRAKLTWPLRFDIANGIARGLLYLHQDSRFRIIHRDLKVSNVLLDKNMIPKISDFGMARIFGRDETEAITRKVVGTYGYMSPEYALNGIFSVKSDVFSYGILLLEIISGKRSTGFHNSCGDLSLHGWVWRNWKEGKRLDIIDPIIIASKSSSSSFKTHETLRCIHIGLLCVQDRAEDRPEMSSVMVMLGSETTTLPEPKQPEFCVGRGTLEPELSKQGDDEWTVNQITRSVIDAR